MLHCKLKFLSNLLFLKDSVCCNFHLHSCAFSDLKIVSQFHTYEFYPNKQQQKSHNRNHWIHYGIFIFCMAEEVQHVCYLLSSITYQKYRSLHLLDYIYVLAEWTLGRLEFWSLGVLWYLVDHKNLRLKVFVNVILSLQCLI